MVGMIIVGEALFETGVARVVGQKIISVVGTNEKVFIAALILVSVLVSSFLSNTATAAMMLPVAASAVAASDGKFSKKNSFMVVGFSAVAGGGLTLVGSTPQLIAQSLLLEGGHETMGFFELSYAGIPKIILLIVYYLTIGHTLQKKVFTFPEVQSDDTPAQQGTAEKDPKSFAKMCVSTGVLVLCIIGFVSEIWSIGVVAMVGAVICVVTGCISQKKVFQKMDWTTIAIIGCSFGFAAGLDRSGAGLLLAQSIINLFGDGITPFILCAIFALIAIILGNIMSHTATASILIPIVIFVSMELGYDVKSIVMPTVIAANVTYLTPISTPPITMTLAAGYRFMDYVKVGGLLNVLSYLLIVAMFPLLLNI